MKEFTFSAYCTFGKGDSGETWIDVKLTEEDAERLIKYGTQADVYYGGFSRCEELKDLYQRIYALAVKQITEELRDGDLIDEKDSSNPQWEADDTYPCGVNFPKEFEDMLVEDE